MADPNPNPSASDVGAALSVEEAWHNLMQRIGAWVPQRIQSGHNILNAVDIITGRKSS